MLKRPVPEAITRGLPFGPSPGYPNQDQFHYGLDWLTPKGTPCWFREAGTIIFVGLLGELGLYCQMQSEADSSRFWGLAHLSQIDARFGQHVFAGEPVALTGGVPGEYGSGKSTGPHLHEQVNIGWRWGERIDPDSILEEGMTPEQREKLEYVRVVLNAWAEELQGQVDYWQSRPYPKTDSLSERQAAELRGLVNILEDVLGS